MKLNKKKIIKNFNFFDFARSKSKIFFVTLKFLKNNSKNLKKVFKEIRYNGIISTLSKINGKLKFHIYEQKLLKNEIKNFNSEKKIQDVAGEVLSSDKSIVFTIPCLSYGGGELYMLNIAKAINKMDSEIKIFVIVPDFVAEFRNDIKESYNFIKFISIRDFVQKNDITSSYTMLKDLLLYIKPKILHNINSSIAWELIIKEKFHLKLYIDKIYACIFSEQHNDLGELIGFSKDYLEKSIDYLDLLISDNKEFKNFSKKTFSISERNIKKFKVLYCPVKLNPSETIDKCRHKYFNEKLDFKKFIWIGRLDDQKNIGLAFKIALLNPNIEIHIFGSKVIGDVFFGKAPNNIIFKGLTFDIPKTILSDNYSAFILTSKYEGLPNILIECGFLGIPIIAPNVGGVSELINDNTGYLLSKKPKPEDYIGTFQKIMTEQDKRIAKSKKLIDIIETRHTIDNLIKDMKNIEYLSFDNTYSETLVSIIIPCFNQYEFLASCIESCYASYAGPLEIIIIDDCSTEKKKSQFQFILSQIYKDIKFINNEANIGLAATRNVGLKNAQGDYIQFLDADDILLPSKISNQIKFINNIPEPQKIIALSDCIHSNNDMSLISYESTIKQFELNLENLLLNWERGFSIPIHSGLFPKSIIKYSFNEKLPAKEDWFFWINLLANDYKLEFINEISLVYRMNDKSMTKSKFLMSGQALINVSYYILDYLDTKISTDTKVNFLNSITQHYQKFYIPNSIDEIKNKKNEITIENNSKNTIEEIKTINTEKKPIIDVTVLIPVYNHYEYLSYCIDSVLNQSYMPNQILLLNDNSSDIRVKELLKKYEDNYSNIIKFIDFNENIGISKIQNYGINSSNSKYIAFLDCDDYLEPDAFKEISNYINNNIDYIFTDNYHIYNNNKKHSIYGGYSNIHFTSQSNIKNDLLNGMIASHLKVIKTESIKECNLFDESLTGVQDWDLALKFCKNKFSFFYLNMPLYNHRIHNNSVTNSMKIIQFKLTNIVRRKYTVIKYPNLINKSFKNEINIYHKCELSKIHEYLSNNFKLIFVLNEESTLDDYSFICEFNGFFDYIKLNKLQYAHISGYLWDSKILTK